MLHHVQFTDASVQRLMLSGCSVASYLQGCVDQRSLFQTRAETLEGLM